jgi:hypothetical protein
MSTLEFLLLTLSERIRNETGNAELAEAAEGLASESHGYVPSFGEESESLRTIANEWREKYPVGKRG